MKLKEPRMIVSDLIAGGSIFLGLLLFLISLHILAISTEGAIKDVLTTTFTIFLTIYSTALLFGIVIIIIQFLTWLTWSINTPTWKKKKGGFK